MVKPLLEVKDLKVQFGTRLLLSNFNWAVEGNQCISILGASGSGKSTFLRALAGLLTPNSGSVVWNFAKDGAPLNTSKDTPSSRVTEGDVGATFGFVFQESQLLPWRTVLENVLLPLELQKPNRPTPEENLSSAREVLTQVKLLEAQNLFPHQLSGGMKMRVSIARALVARPKVLFMDEPFAALDELTRFRLQEDLRKLAASGSLSIFFVTHSIYEAAFISDRVVVLSGENTRGEGVRSFKFDHAIHYPRPRNKELRTSDEYQLEVRTLIEKMHSEDSL